MSDYAIGDVQGCRAALEDLLANIRFDPACDRLWFAGDLVARGPDSLGTLRLIQQLGHAADSVLGNHDLHLLAAHHGLASIKPKDATAPILAAHDRDALMTWLQHRPLLLDLPFQHVMTHAGIPPFWSLINARQYAGEVEHALRDTEARQFFAAMYGDEPSRWRDNLLAAPRLRMITNCLTRMRLLHVDGRLDFAHKEELETAPPGLSAWFAQSSPLWHDTRIIFGHWAALKGVTHQPNCIAIDTGCVWGEHLCAYRLDDGQRFYSRQGLK